MKVITPFLHFSKRSRMGFPRKRLSGFSLVEVMLAMGVVSFSFLTLVGLLGVGAMNFKNANTTSVTTQIAQRVINEAQQSDFSDLITPPGSSAPSAGNTPFFKTIRYFDNQGNELTHATGAIYQVNTRITPSTVLPQSEATSVPNACVATVTLQVADNPGGASLATQALWTPSSAGSISTFFTFVSQNN